MTLTSQIRYVRALDVAAGDGSGLAGLAFGDITAKYLVHGGTLQSLTTENITTLGTYQAPTSAAHIRIKLLADAAPTTGVLEIHFHNTQLATGSKLWLFLSASGAAFQPLEVNLTNVPDWDTLFKYDLSTITGEAARSLLNAIRFLRNKWSISGNTLTVTKEDDSTPAWSATLSSSSGADPITGVDPN